jgi:putative ABC transport system permease protein
MRQSVLASLCGVAAGIGAALALTGLLRAFLFGVEPADPVAIGGAAIGLTAVVMIAAAIPSFRAARVDPAEPLRRE